MVAFFPSCILATHCVLLSVEKEKFGFTRSCSLVACCPSWILATEKVGSTKFYSSCSPTNRPSCTLCGEKRGKFQIRIWERIVLQPADHSAYVPKLVLYALWCCSMNADVLNAACRLWQIVGSVVAHVLVLYRKVYTLNNESRMQIVGSGVAQGPSCILTTQSGRHTLTSRGSRSQTAPTFKTSQIGHNSCKQRNVSKTRSQKISGHTYAPNSQAREELVQEAWLGDW